MSSRYYAKAVDFVKLGRLNVALHCLDRALDLNPRDAEVWLYKGVLLGKLGKHEEELKCYDKAVEIDPNNPKAWYNRGAVLGNFGRYREALPNFEEAQRKGHPRAAAAIEDCQNELKKFRRSKETASNF